ncbi:MAG: MarR family winged helix-turn-helix transcriptional regulator [Eubacteriaceae bacterium]
MFKLENCVSYIATNASKDLAEGFERKLKEHGISRVQWTALYYIGKYESINQKQLSLYMRIKESSTTRLVDRMEKEGYIKRCINKENRRNIELVLTDEGKKTREGSLYLGDEYSDYISEGISQDDLNIFIKVLDIMRKNANRY